MLYVTFFFLGNGFQSLNCDASSDFPLRSLSRGSSVSWFLLAGTSEDRLAGIFTMSSLFSERCNFLAEAPRLTLVTGWRAGADAETVKRQRPV